MKKIHKLTIIIAVSAVALLVLFSGTFAFFINSSSDTTNAKVGGIDVSSSHISLSNSGNFNPGDERPEYELPEDHRPGTEHKLSFNVKNSGTKSVGTRNIITVSLKDSNGNTIDPTIIDLYQTKDGATTETLLEKGTIYYVRAYVDLCQKYYILSDGHITNTKPEDTSDVVALQYVINGPILNGVGESAELEENVDINEYENIYAVGVDFNAGNEYQAAKIEINVKVQSIQFRNTNTSSWTEIFSEDIQGNVS